MKYSVVIPTYNHCDDFLKPCIESILKYTDIADIEVIISANGCTDNTVIYLNELRYKFLQLGYSNHLQIICNDDPIGYSKATNLGIQKAIGDKVILLNNDCVLLNQDKNDWLKLLDYPFVVKKETGISCVIKSHSQITKRDFAIFFCVMIDKKVFDKIGYLSEEFEIGGCEDIDFCTRALDAGFQIEECIQKTWAHSKSLYTGYFPIYHRGEGTMNDISLVEDWKKVFENNELILARKYNREWYKHKLSNNYERAVFLKGDNVFPREKQRYEWARDNLLGTKVLEIGCSTGFGLQFLPDNIDYTGLDYDERSIQVAKNEKWKDNVKFVQTDINKYELGFYDTIIAFEIIEHLDNGLEIAQRLKKHCRRLLLSVPYKETPGFWGEHHRLHMLDESHLPDFQYFFIGENGEFDTKPTNTRFNLMVCRYDTE